MAYRRTKPEITGFQPYRKAYRMPCRSRTSIIPHQNRKSKHKPKSLHSLFSITSSLFPFHCGCSSCVPRPS